LILDTVDLYSLVVFSQKEERIAAAPAVFPHRMNDREASCAVELAHLRPAEEKEAMMLPHSPVAHDPSFLDLQADDQPNTDHGKQQWS